ncbi:hypothetical protein RHOER0001_5356 [Rhodococcus erythropolis SK121]|nr:hypothetical protein RHOER0001_5356 [Rhodococcus erythropolis SK121]
MSDSGVSSLEVDNRPRGDRTWNPSNTPMPLEGTSASSGID